MQRVIGSVVLAVVLVAPTLAPAQQFPERPVRLIVPFPPGGGTDTFGRILAARLSEFWGQQVIVDNRSGAQGNVGTALLAKATADGHTVGIAHHGTMTINVAMYSRPGFDTLKELTGVARGVDTPNVITAHPSIKANNVRELIALAKQMPGKLNYASTGAHQQLTGELFKATTGIDLLHVPYKGAGPAVIDLVGGNLNLMVSNPTSTVPHVKSGRLRALGVIGGRRLEVLPDAQTIGEAGFPQLAEYTEWYGIAAPAGTPRAVLQRIEAGVLKAMAMPEVLQRLTDVGQQPAPLGGDEFNKQISRDHERWGKMVRAAGLKVD